MAGPTYKSFPVLAVSLADRVPLDLPELPVATGATVLMVPPAPQGPKALREFPENLYGDLEATSAPLVHKALAVSSEWMGPVGPREMSGRRATGAPSALPDAMGILSRCQRTALL
jgi:hypothetical protein